MPRMPKTPAVDGSASNLNKNTMLMIIVMLLALRFLLGVFFGGTQFFVDQETVKRSSASNHTKHHPTLSRSLIDGAIQFVASRERAYEEAEEYQTRHKHWKMRGVGHLYTYHNMVLAAQVVDEKGTPDTIRMGKNSIKIYNVHPTGQDNRTDCHLLTLWVRVLGPEIFSGKPYAVQEGTTCFWNYDFTVAVAGSYTVDAKLLFWNDQAPVVFYDSDQKGDAQTFNAQSQCKVVYPGNQIPDGQFQQAPQNTSVAVFKPYSPLMSCCEMCRRLPDCQYWATPPRLLPTPSTGENGCELLYKQSTSPEWIPTTRILPNMTRRQISIIRQKRREAEAAQKKEAEEAAAQNPGRLRHSRQRNLAKVVQAWGSPYSDNPEVAYFLGCGWSFMFTLEFPCLSGDLDDHVYMATNTFKAVKSTSKATTSQPQQLPLCTVNDESLTPNGTESVGRWVLEPWPTAEECPPYKEVDMARGRRSINYPDHPHCYHRSDLSHLNKKCLEVNCKYIEVNQRWNSTPLQFETQFNGIWRNYHCDYLEFTNTQLDECFQLKKIKGFQKNGASIIGMFMDYVERRLENVTRYDGEDGKTIILSTHKWPHLMWKMGSDQWKEELENTPAQEEAYWLSPLFATSEREPYVHLGRALQLIDVAEPILKTKGYRMINMYDPSAAMSYDTAAQADGLHIVGPPMKNAVNKILHHMCSGVVEGSRM